MWLTRASLAHPVAVTLFYVAISLVGFVSYALLARSVLPDIAFPTIAITASYPGASSEELERLVVEPLEDAMNGVAGVDRVSATAQNGVAQVVVRFRFGTPLQSAQSDVQQAVDAARVKLPDDLLPPVVSRDDPSQRPVIELAVSSAALDMRSLSIALDQTILPALRMAPGVGLVRVAGQPQRAFVVVPNAAALAASSMSELDVYRAMEGAALIFPGGSSAAGGTQHTVAVRSDARSSDELLDRSIPMQGANIRARDIARVYDSSYDPTTVSSFDGDDAMLLYVTASQGAHANAVIAGVRRAVETLRQNVPLVRIDEYHSDQPFTDAAIAGVLQTLLEGVALTVLTMLLFLHAWRNAAVAALAIPSSLLATFIAMLAFGFSLNVLSLMGLAMTVGILVDDSIVIVEAISRAAQRGVEGDEAALEGRRELGGATIAITLVDVAVFAPIAAMSGVVGEFMREFAAVIVTATAFSLLVSFTLAPLLSARWALRVRSNKTLPWTFRTGPLKAIRSFAALAARRGAQAEARIVARYAFTWLPFAWRWRRAVLAGSAFAAIASCVPLATGTIASEFSPPAARGETFIDLTFPSGTPLVQTDRGARAFARRLLEDDAVADIVTTAGRAFDGTSDVLATNVVEVGIELRDQSGDGTSVAHYAKSLGAVAPGASILESGRGMGGAAPIAFQIGGEERQLSNGAANIAALLHSDPDADDVRRSDVGTVGAVTLRIDNARANVLGVNADDAALTARIASAGALATRVRTDDGLVDVLVRSPRSMRGAYVRSQGGALIPLGDLLDTSMSPEPLVIHRENRSRVVIVTANTRDGAPAGRTVRAVAPEIPRALPAGTFVEPRGDIEQFLDTVSAMGRAFGLSILLAYAVLAVLYRSYTLPLVVMATVPLASIGAFGALALTGEPLNLYSMLGIIMLVGLVAKNGILLVEFADRGVRDGTPALEAMQRAAARRFRPVVMTTVAMIGGMLPLALGDAAGAEYRRALGTVVIGGLSSSLFLTFFIVPIVFVILRGGVRYARNRRMPACDPVLRQA
jgi:HAE1 family hydrophobic/amphiphilic exporter-1